MTILNSKSRNISLLLLISLISLYFINVIGDVDATISNDNDINQANSDEAKDDKEMLNLKRETQLETLFLKKRILLFLLMSLILN